ncbi:MAG: HD domain-containing protein [Pseudobdellovibrio sp.]
MNLDLFENLISEKIKEKFLNEEPSHDFLHFSRVVKIAKELTRKENAKIEVVMPAAWLHDFVLVPKDDPKREQASNLSAEAAIQFLKEINYPDQHFTEIKHAIRTHSYSAGIRPETVEAQIVQDADRLDALGAIGIARCFVTAGLLKNKLYSITDPFCEKRTPNDRENTIDHFYKKLLNLEAKLNTPSAKEEGVRRTQVLRQYLKDLSLEISN